jgi:hypothetical protein
MNGERHLIQINGALKLMGYQEYTRNINKGVEMKYMGKLQHVRTKIKEPYTKHKVWELFKENVDWIANKGKENCLTNFKTLVYNRL